jgi:hypothetical protein
MFPTLLSFLLLTALVQNMTGKQAEFSVVVLFTAHVDHSIVPFHFYRQTLHTNIYGPSHMPGTIKDVTKLHFLVIKIRQFQLL